MVLDGDGNRWNAHVDPASGNTYYVNERTGVSSWTLPKKGTTNGAASNGASPLKIALGVVIIAVLACFLPADSALRGAVPFSFPTLYGAASFFITPSRRACTPRRSLAALRSLRLVDVVAALPGAPSAERLLEAVSTRHLPDAATAAGGSVPTKKLAGAAVVGLAGYKKFVAPN